MAYKLSMSFIWICLTTSKKSIKLFNNDSSLICWVNTKIISTRFPNLLALDCRILTLKQPSPEVKPAIHWGCILLWVTLGLGTATLLGKASFNKGLNPLFIVALIFIIFCKHR